jgi:hypothetical protein
MPIGQGSAEPSRIGDPLELFRIEDWLLQLEKVSQSHLSAARPRCSLYSMATSCGTGSRRLKTRQDVTHTYVTLYGQERLSGPPTLSPGTVAMLFSVFISEPVVQMNIIIHSRGPP